MEKIASFQVDHLRLKRGIFVSRRDRFGDTVVTTFDIRMKEPNREPVIDVPALHTLEHLGATFLRSHPIWNARTIYFGPMGCRTGLYAVLAGDYASVGVLPLIKEMFDWISAFTEDIPGAAPAECGNWRDQNLDMAKWEARRFLEVLRDPSAENLNYPA
ncbi:MAG: S-ribosylhomocysteine lyase [Treponemataceae bacterium]